jgi:outer membrane protein assembly factor BamB
MRRTSILSLILSLSLFAHAHALAGNWPQFRGPTGMGMTDEKNLPTEWDGKTGKNVLWKSPLPINTAPYSSPVVWGDRIFVTTTKDADPKDHHLLCFAKADGKQLWNVEVPVGLWKKGRNNGYPTPAVDGERVYAMFGTAVIVAMDLEGKEVWRHELEKYEFDVAIGGSPIVVGEDVLLLCDLPNKKDSSLIALDRKTGKVHWQASRPEARYGHSTPVLADVGGKKQLLVSAGHGLEGLDPADGKVIWSVNNDGDTSSPVFAAGLVYADSGRGGPGVAVDPSGSGDVTQTHVKWKLKGLSESLSSPVVSGDFLYRMLGERLRCFRLKDGEQVYEEKLPGADGWASPIATADGLLYFATSGKSYVVKAGEKFEIVAKNDLGDPNRASAAISDGRIYLKGEKFLWCVGKK